MGSFIETIQKSKFIPSKPYKDDLPISHSSSKNPVLVPDPNPSPSLRKRISSSFSVRLQPTSAAFSSSWAFRKSRSMSSIGEQLAGGPLRKWWEWSWGWILSRKPAFTRDLELNEEETAILGFQNKGSLKHLFYKVRAEIRKLVRSRSSNTLPTSHKFSYDSFSYVQNFDDGIKRGDQEYY